MSTDIILRNLEPKWQNWYRVIKFFLYAVFVFFLGIFSYRTLFPSSQFVFFFKTPDASKNTLIEPRRTNGEAYRSGKISASEGLVFDAPLEELESDYSRIKVRLILEKSNSGAPEKIEVIKSYRAFFYPEITAPSAEVLEKLKSSGFLQSPLFSYGEAVYIIDGKNARPFNSVETFQALGYDWSDVRTAQGDEFMIYEKGKLFTAAHPHPDGTIFVTRESANYYVIFDGKKIKLESPGLIEKDIRHAPVMVDEASLIMENECVFKESFSIFNDIYDCEIPIDSLKGLTGNDYQFEIGALGDFKIKEARVVLDRSFGWNNLKKSLSDIRKRIVQSYVQEN